MNTKRNSHKSAVPLMLLAFISTLCLAGHAQSSIDASRKNAIVTAIEKVSPAVVTINVVHIERERAVEPFFNDFWGLFGVPYARQRAVESIGSGFIFDPQGHILTNYHVLQGADQISSVVLPDGRTVEVEVTGADERTDIAVLRAKGEGLPHIPLGRSDDLMIGEWAIAIGNPFGNLMRDPQPSVSVGVISANHRRVSREVGGGDRLYQDLIQTDAAINPGNSGGPLVNAKGEVVGVNTIIFSNSGGSQGLGFAIPVDRVKRVADEIIRYGQRRNPWFGFKGEAVGKIDAYTLRQLNIQSDTGVLITKIVETSPAYHAGVRPGDVLLEVNGESVSDPTDVDFINWGLFIGDPVKLTLNREGKRVYAEFTIKEVSR